MDKEQIRTILPEEPPKGLLRWTLGNCDDELGPQFLVYRPIRVPVYDMAELMCGGKPKRNVRAAECRCSRCGGHFLTELDGGVLTMWVDESGEWWPLDPTGNDPFEDEDHMETGYTVEIGERDNMPCPFCGETVRTIEARKLKGGRIKQILVASICTVDRYAAVMYWLVQRKISDVGDDYDVFPRDAYVLDEKGTVHRYTHKNGGGSFRYERQDTQWRLVSGKRDSMDMVYHDWGSISNKKKGGIFYEDIPDLDGTTAEKTGLQAYASFDGQYSLQYLKMWKKYPFVENLANTGWNRLLYRIVMRSFDGYDTEQLMDSVIDRTKRKPHEILEMSKKDFKAIRKAGKQWDYDCQVLWQVFRKSGFESATKFMIYRDMFTDTGMRALAALRLEYGEADVEKIIRYLKKQDMRPAEVGILLDTRNAAKAIAAGRELSPEELWPRNLQAAHDRFNRMRLQNVDAKKAEKYQSGFDEVVRKYGHLQWTDGDLCVIIPKSYAELVREGDTLRHCVGGYSDSHIAGRDTIFFIRRYRRPERCYYTLDINMTGEPYRVQLHGYGNERHGINKQYRHKIPQKVLEFCARWENEILLPWWQETKKKEEKTA